MLARLATARRRPPGCSRSSATDWLLLDTELLPWSAKAGELVRSQYAAVGAAARAAVPAAVAVLEQAAARGLDVAELLALQRERAADAQAFTEAYRRYCWPTDGLDGLALAPFQVLAAAGQTFDDPRARLAPGRWPTGSSTPTPRCCGAPQHRYVDVTDPASEADATTWWTELTAAGGEGMVVKPAANLVRGRKGLVQPGLKVRGREYLRIVYGPDYTRPEHLERLRERNLGRKRGLAQREYALGLEALERAARGEPLWRVHECVFGVLALESEPVDPRL